MPKQNPKNKKEPGGSEKVRRLSLPKRRWYNPRTWKRLQPLPPRAKISSVRVLVRDSFRMLGRMKRVFFGICAVYAIGLFIFVNSFSLGSSGAADSSTTSEANGILGSIADVATKFVETLSNSTANITAVSGVYQVIIMTICSLAIIWSFRQALSSEKFKLKAGFYKGMTPLVPYLLVMSVFGVQLIPIAVGGYLYSVVTATSILVGWENAVALLVFILLAVWSLFMITHTIFALYIVTLPDMTPLKALRSAKKMVFRRRFTIWRKITVFAVILGIAVLLALLPFILWLPAMTSFVFFILTVIITMYTQAFMYTLYREIL